MRTQELAIGTTAYKVKWDSRSSIRSRPEKIIDFDLPGYFFPIDKQPVLLDSQVIKLGQKAKETILLQTLFKYLHDIIHLEIKLINTACHYLIYDELPVVYSDQQKINAYTVLIDEYYHVYLAKNMMMTLEQHFPYRHTFSYPASDAHLAIVNIKNNLHSKYHVMFEILAVCIFETTLVKELVEFFNSPEVHPSIRYYVNDHMNDESRHYGYFFELLEHTWKNLPEDYQCAIGGQMAIFIKYYLSINSDKKFNETLLTALFNDASISSQIIERLYHRFEVTPDVPTVKNVIGVLKKSNILGHPFVMQGFKEIGWNV